MVSPPATMYPLPYLMHDAEEITRLARSNLAFALRVLPKERRADAVVFYAFCRVIDDLADDTERPLAERETALQQWKQGLENGFPEPDPLQREVAALREKYDIPTPHLTAVIEGCLLDLRPQRFGTWQDLSQYTWKVACAVGLCSIRIFGATHPNAEPYAIALGHALQLTNILRDVGEDLHNGVRIYLPLVDLTRFQYSERDLIGRVHDGRFIAMMNHQADRAEAYFQEAASLLPKSDLRALAAAEIMREIYHTLLQRMRQDHFHVFNHRYRLSKARKVAIFSKHLLGLGGAA